MAELNIFTQQLQAMLPQWMKMAKDPDSVGAQFLDTFGLEFEQISGYLNSMSRDQHIGTADISQIDITYKVPFAFANSEVITEIRGHKTGKIYAITIVDSLREFYSATPEDHVAIVDSTEGLVYIRPASSLIDADKQVPYDYLEIDGVPHYDIILHHIWNAFDEFGLLLGLQRLYGERNGSYKARILDVFISPGNSTKSGLINAISRELGITKDKVKVNELVDKAFKDTLLNDDGSPTQKLLSYVQKINKLLGFTWDNMSWDQAYWRSIEEDSIGLSYLPHIWDVSLDNWSNEHIQSGIGDTDDLLVRAPEKLDNVRNFNYTVGVRGIVKDGSLIYPEHSFKYKITAKGTIVNQESRPESYKYTVIASEIIPLYFIVRAFQQYNYTTTIDFQDLTGFIYDIGNHLEVVPGTSMMSPKTNNIVEIKAVMETTSKIVTPTLDSMTVKWKDTEGTIHDLIFDSQADFDKNNAEIVTEKQNVITNATGAVELGYGDFYHVLNTSGDWNKGTVLNVDITDDGSIRLVQPI